jgi:hypothetical protein
MRRSPVFLAAVATLASAVSACGGEAEPARPPRTTRPATISEAGAGGAVTLTFAWPDGVRGRVESSRRVERQGPGPASGGWSTARWRIAIRRQGRETQVRTEELALEPASPRPADVLHGMLVVATYLPSVRFGADVEELELVDPDTTGEGLRAAVRAASHEEIRALPEWETLAPMVAGDPVMLSRQAASFLRPIAALDAMEVHARRSVSTTQAIPTPGGPPAEQSTTTRLLGVGPCYEGGPIDGCVSIEIVAVYDAQAMQAAIGGEGTIRAMEGTLRLVVESGTLLPHRIEAEKRTRFVVPIDDEPVEMSETESLRWLFRWELDSLPVTLPSHEPRR